MLIHLELTLPRDARFVAVMRQVTCSVMSELEVPRSAIDDMALAVSEACTNAVRYAAGTSSYNVTLDVGDDTCLVDVVDMGPGFPGTDGRLPGLDAESGRGLALIRTVVDRLEVKREAAGTHLRLIKCWASARPAAVAPAG